jgi:hypothetical protein
MKSAHFPLRFNSKFRDSRRHVRARIWLFMREIDSIMLSFAAVAVSIGVPSLVGAVASARSIHRTAADLERAPDDGYAMESAELSRFEERESQHFVRRAAVERVLEPSRTSKILHADGSWTEHHSPTRWTDVSHVRRFPLPSTRSSSLFVYTSASSGERSGHPPPLEEELRDYEILGLLSRKLRSVTTVAESPDVGVVTKTYDVVPTRVTFSREAECVSTSRAAVAAEVAAQRHIVPVVLSSCGVCFAMAALAAAAASAAPRLR